MAAHRSRGLHTLVFAGGFIGNNAALNDAGARTTLQFDSCVAANKRRLGEYGPYDQVWTPCWQQHSVWFMRNVEAIGG
jgi:hypothetical protein